MLNKVILFIFTGVLFSCGSSIDVELAFKDEIPPEIIFQSTPQSINGAENYSLSFKVEDELKGSGVYKAELYYSPDGDEDSFKLLADITNKETIKFCTPNKSHPKPTFKIEATDRSGNKAEETLGDKITNFTINLMSEPPMPSISSTEGTPTNNLNTDIRISACVKHYCDNDAIYYEPVSNDLYVAISGTKPTSTDPSWISCADFLANGETTSNFIGEGDTTFKVWVKSEDMDVDSTQITAISTDSEDITITHDTTPPNTAPAVVEGTNLTAKSLGSYRLTDCTDFSKVLINKLTGAPPLATDAGWQTCSDTLLSLTFTDMVAGDNVLSFWFKDIAENVAPAFISYTTKYVPPAITVVAGPTIYTPDAPLTIEFCEEADISHVFFNLTGTIPSATAPEWQTCSKAVGALTYGKLIPGPSTLKAFLKYTDNSVSQNPLDIPVFYSPQMTWVESPSVNRPQAKFTVYSCEGINEIFFNKTTIPGAGDAGWQTCALTAASLSYNTLSVGAQTLNVWYKDALNNVYGDNTTVNVTYTPPSTTVKDDPTITTATAFLTASECTNISHVLTTVDDVTVPAVGNGGWLACSTANYALQSPALGAEGAHTLRTWFKFTDNYILPISSDHIVNYDAPDLIPPPLTLGDGADLNITSTLANGDAGGPPELVIAADSRADFTINSCDPIAVGAEDDITHVIVTTTNTQPLVDHADWQICSTIANAIQSASLPDGNQNVYIWYKDAADNITVIAQLHNFDVNTTSDLTPPPRPIVTVVNAPTLTSAPAEITIADCTDVDQVFINLDGDAIPLASAEGWNNCSIVAGAIKYKISIAGNYTIQAWFKDAAGNLNTSPRKVSFIFAPVPTALPTPIATWSMDQNHFYNGQLVDIRGNNNLRTSNFNNLNFSTAKVKEGLDFTGPNTYAVTKIEDSLKPTVSITVGLWAYLTNNDASTQTIVGNASSGTGYALLTQASELRFSVNGSIAKVATSSYPTGWHYLTGVSDGSTIKLFVDGLLEDTFTFGAPQNISYGCAKIFAIGGGVNGCSDNIDAGTYFTGKVDEVNLWGFALTDDNIFDLFVDNSNDYKVNQSNTKPADITDATFLKAHEQTALLSIETCGGGEFIYINETTHPPLPDDPTWQPCNQVSGGVHLAALSQGYHELKVWAKDEFDNISDGYQKVDTTIESMFLSPTPILYWNLDNTHISSNDISSIYSLHHAVNNGAQTGLSSIQNEGALFVKAQTDYIEVKHASASMLESNFSISIWARLTNNDSRNQTLIGNRIEDDGYSLEIDNASGELRFRIGTGAALREIGVLTTSYNTDYHNITATYNGQVSILYIDGQPVANNDFGSVVKVSYDCLPNMTIGAGASCNTGAAAGSHFDDYIDEAIVFNSVLSPTEVDNLFNGSDTIPPIAIAVTPKNNTYTIEVPVAKFNVSNCSDIASVYISLDANIPDVDAANWQTCSTSGDQIESSTLANGANTIKVWFKDPAGNISISSTDIAMTFNYDFTIPSPDSYWPLDDVNIEGATAYDVTGNNEATLFNTIANASGVSYEAIDFNGTNSYIKADYNATLQPTDKVTLSAWVNVAAWPGAQQIIAGNLNGGGYALLLGNNTIEWHVKANGSVQTVSIATGAYPAGNNYLLTGIYDDGKLRLFINSTEVQSLDLGSNYLIEYDYTNAFTIGTQAGVTTNDIASVAFFSGMIDEVSFWQDALTDTVVTGIYNRGLDGDKNYYDVTPPTIPISLSINYYNSLVSRANVTVTDCTGVYSMLISASTFPPDKNDEDWQLCNTLTGGTLSKELKTGDAFGKLWVKDEFGNISKSFQYVPITTLYDKPIARPIVHWTFDNPHYDGATRIFLDRIAGSQLIAEKVDLVDVQAGPGTTWNIPYNGSATTITSGNAGVLNEAFQLTGLDFTRCDSCEVTKPTEKVSISSWVYITNGYSVAEQYIVGNLLSGKGYGFRFANNSPIGARIYFEVNTTNADILAPYLETSNIASAWHLVTGTYDGQKASLYIDGILVKSFTAPAPSNIDYAPGVKFSVGSMPTTGTLPDSWVLSESSLDTTYANKDLDEVIIWDQALTGLMVSSLYHNGADILYNADSTEPALPIMSQENQRDTLYDNRLYATASTCSDVSGVLINEGTKPDKQDARWEVCRTRNGSFKYDLSYTGGHTVTYWFKDLAGNVTSTSSDLVVSYTNNPLPLANAYWPLDELNFVSQFSRDTISLTNEHDLYSHDFKRVDNPTAIFQVGKQQESMAIFESYLSADMTKLLRPVNELTVSGWFYLTNGDAINRVLVDNMRYETSSTLTRGYKIYKTGTILYFQLGLNIQDRVTISTSLGAIPTGWHLITGVFDNDTFKIYIDASEVATSTLAEEDFINYVSYQTRLVFGAESDNTTKPTDFFSEKIDEIAIWGQALSPGEITDVFNKGNAGTYLFDVREPTYNVNNAFVYHYDNFESRVRMTILDCTNTPYIYVGPDSLGAPNPISDDWQKCNTRPGSIFSQKLAPGIQYVRIWSKNNYGDVSAGYATEEIPIITETSDIILPKFYWDFNSDHRESGLSYDMILNSDMTFSNSVFNQQNFVNDDGLQGTSGGTITAAGDYTDNGHAQTISFWTELTQADATEHYFYNQQNTKIYQTGGRLYFQIYRAKAISFVVDIANTLSYLSIDLADISTGKHYITTSYDGQEIKLYIDSILWTSLNISNDKYQANEKIRLENGVSNNYFLSDAGGGPYSNKILEDFMLFEETLTQTQIEAHYNRVAKIINAGDTTPPATAPIVTVSQSIFGGGKWLTNDQSAYLKVSDCTDIAGVMVVIGNAALPAKEDIGWQQCSTEDGAIDVPDLSLGDNNIYVWYKDSVGNIKVVSDDIIIDYTIDATPTPKTYLSFDANTIFNSVAFEGANLHNAELLTYDSVAGKVNEAFQGDITRNVAIVSASNDFKPIDELSISLWTDRDAAMVRCPSGIDSSHTILTTMNNDNTGYELSIHRYGSSGGCSTTQWFTLRIDLSLDGVKYKSEIPYDWFVGGMEHVIVTFDGRRVKWFLNNVLRYTNDFKVERSITYTNPNTPLLIGAGLINDKNFPKKDTYFGGIVDELAIFDKALVPTQVNEIYTKGNSGQNVYDANRPINTPLNTVGTIFQPAADFTFGDRIKVSISDCTNMDLVLVNDSLIAPTDSDENWQACNQFTGGILSASLTIGSLITPRLWAKSFEGEVSAASGTLNAATITLPANSVLMFRPSVLWSLDEVATGHTTASNFFDTLYYHPNALMGIIPAGSEPTATSNIDPNDSVQDEGFSFDGVNDFLFHSITGNNTFNSNFSISLWANLTKGDTLSKTLLSNKQKTTDDTGGLSIHIENNLLKVSTSFNTIDSQVFTERVLEVEYSNLNFETGFHNIVTTFNGERLDLYLDGIFVATNYYSFYGAGRVYTYGDYQTPWIIGAEADNGGLPEAGTYFDSYIDEITMWDEELTAFQVTQIFNYGAQFLPSNTGDGIAPTDPGIGLKDNQTITNKPFAQLEIPTCTGANGQKINAIYIAVQKLNPDDAIPSAPDNLDPMWIYCTTDEGKITSDILNLGDSRLYIYFKDEEGDISAAVNYEITYIAPEMINPRAYYDFEAATYSASKAISLVDNFPARSVSSITETGLVGAVAFQSSPYALNNTFVSDLNFVNDFTVSFWIKTNATDGVLFNTPNQITIRKESTDNIYLSLKTKTRFYSLTTKGRTIPNDWNHILLTRNGSIATLYLNGKAEESINIANDELYESSGNWSLGNIATVFDELALYNKGLNEEQSLYLFYSGIKSLPVFYNSFATVTAPIAEHYYNFNTADIATTILNDKGSSPENLTIVNAVSTGDVDAIEGESFNFTRFEDSAESGANTVGPPEILQAANPIQLGAEFTISTWVKFNKGSTNGNEEHTLLSQWGDTSADQSFRLKLHRYGSAANINRLYFEMRVGAFNTLYSTFANLDPTTVDASWHHVVIKRISKKLIIYIDGKQSGFSTTWFTNPVNIGGTNFRIGDTSITGYDENRFQGLLDEMAIWENTAIDFTAINEIYQRGLNNTALSIAPQITLATLGTDVTTSKASLTINDCSEFTHVMILDTGAPIPGSGDAGWQTCSTDVAAILSDLLNFNTTNNLVAYFKNGVVVDGYSFSFDIVHNQTDTTPPVSPTIALETGTVVSSSIAKFTVNSCIDIGGIFIGTTGSTPTAVNSGWKNCTTINSATIYDQLSNGTNNISFWFKDTAENISLTTRDFVINYTEPLIPLPNIYIPGDKFYSGAAGAFDLVNDNFFVSNDPTKTIADNDGVINESFNFVDNACIEREAGSLALTTTMSFSSWINISTPAIRSVIASQWSDIIADDSYSIEIDSEGRLCFAMQTVTSSGASSWGSSSYRRTCSASKINFGTWNQIGIVRNAGTVSYYINGVPEVVASFDSAAFSSSTVQLRLGAQDRGGVTNFTTGSLDELSIWSTAMSQDQMEAIYSRGVNNVSIADVLQAQVPPIPYTYWTMDSSEYAPFTLTDLMTNHDLTNIQSGSLTYAQDNSLGLVNQAFEFFNEELLESTSSNVDLGTKFTISTVFSIVDDTDDNASIINKWDAAGNNEFQIYTENENIHVNFTTTTTSYNYQLPTKLVYDVWHNLIVIRNEAELKVFVNGALELFIKTLDVNPLINTTEKIRFGADQTGSANYLSGSIDDTLIWKKSMDSSQAQFIYENNMSASILPLNIKVSVAHPSSTVYSDTPYLTVSDCLDFTHILVQNDGSAAPLDGDGRWVLCDENVAAITSSTLIGGANTLDIWFKAGSIVEGSETTETSIIYIP